jgi:rare lipoprotein A
MKYNRVLTFFAFVMSLGFLSGCTEARYAAHVVKQIPMPGDAPQSQGTFKVGNPYVIKGRQYHPRETYSHVETGVASWYGPNFHGKRTANGEIFNKNDLTAAHRTLQMPSIIRVTNMANGRAVILRVNDRGPFAHDRVIDVSERAASLLGFKNHGTARVKIEVLQNESLQVAQAARSGMDTRGFEVALNQNKARVAAPRPIPTSKPAMANQPYTPDPVTQVVMADTSPAPVVPTPKPLPVQAEPLHSPAATVSSNNLYQEASYNPPLPAATPKNIYVQAGSFSMEQNALDYSSRLTSLGPSKVYLTRVNNQPFFRVRLGPYDNREEAQRILLALNESGNKNAVIVLD